MNSSHSHQKEYSGAFQGFLSKSLSTTVTLLNGSAGPPPSPHRDSFVVPKYKPILFYLLSCRSIVVVEVFLTKRRCVSKWSAKKWTCYAIIPALDTYLLFILQSSAEWKNLDAYQREKLGIKADDDGEFWLVCLTSQFKDDACRICFNVINIVSVSVLHACKKIYVSISSLPWQKFIARISSCLSHSSWTTFCFSQFHAKILGNGAIMRGWQVTASWFSFNSNDWDWVTCRGWGALKGSLGDGVPPRPSYPDPV